MPTAKKVKKAIQKPLASVPDAKELAAIARRKRAARIASAIRICIADKRDFEKYMEIHYGGLEAWAATRFKRHPTVGPDPSVRSRQKTRVPPVPGVRGSGKEAPRRSGS